MADVINACDVKHDMYVEPAGWNTGTSEAMRRVHSEECHLRRRNRTGLSIALCSLLVIHKGRLISVRHVMIMACDAI